MHRQKFEPGEYPTIEELIEGWPMDGRISAEALELEIHRAGVLWGERGAKARKRNRGVSELKNDLAVIILSAGRKALVAAAFPVMVAQERRCLRGLQSIAAGNIDYDKSPQGVSREAYYELRGYHYLRTTTRNKVNKQIPGIVDAYRAQVEELDARLRPAINTTLNEVEGLAASIIEGLKYTEDTANLYYKNPHEDRLKNVDALYSRLLKLFEWLFECDLVGTDTSEEDTKIQSIIESVPEEEPYLRKMLEIIAPKAA